MNVKKTIALLAIGALGVVSAACGGGGATPTRTRVAQAEPTQTPWIIYIPVTVTPGPATATLEPTSTPSAPEATAVPPTQPRPTARPRTAEPQPTATSAEPPTPEPPTASPVPSCGEAYQVKVLTFPENGTTRDVINKSTNGKTIQFEWEPIATYEMDPKIGYRLSITTKRNATALYISQNEFLREKRAILDGAPAWGMTQGDDDTATWFVEVIRTDGEFNDAGDDRQPPTGTVIVCGPPSPSFNVDLHVIE